VNNSLGLSRVRATRTIRSIKERKKWTTNGKDFINNSPCGGRNRGTAGHTPPAQLHPKRGEETSSPPQKATAARPPHYSVAGWG
jgi:hypothetical protein